MPTQIQLRRGTTSEHSSFTGAAGEVTVDTTKKTVVVHDGATAGGMALLPKTMTDGTANGVAYLNGSKVLTTGSALTFDGTNFVLGTGGTSGGFPFTQRVAASGSPVSAYRITNGSDATFDVTLQTSLVSFGTGIGDLAFLRQGSEQMRLTSTGLGIGTSSPAFKLQVEGAANSAALTLLRLNNSGTTSGGPGIASRISFTAGATALGYIQGSNFASGAAGLQFSGDGTNAQATLDSSGNLLVGRTTALASERLSVEGSATSFISRFRNTSATTPSGLFISYTAAAPNDTGNLFFRADDNAATRAEIRSNGGLANYSGNNVNLSDRREKTNFAPAKNYLDTICAIPVQTFNYIDQSEDDPGLTLGVVAQDVQAVAPELVMESNWGSKDDPKMRLSIYQTDLQYALMKALQELKAEFDAYKATHP